MPRVVSCVFRAVLCSQLGLLLALLAYLLLGAVLFHLLEAGHDHQLQLVINHHRENCLNHLWTITERLNVLYEKNWTQLVHQQLRQFEANVVDATRTHSRDLLDHDAQWSFSGALLYSVTVVTTIGYGNLSPKTAEGKLVTMLYAIIGVPLMLICLSNLGSLLAEAFQCLYAYTYTCVCCGRSHNHQHHNRNHHHLHHHHHHSPTESFTQLSKHNSLDDEPDRITSSRKSRKKEYDGIGPKPPHPRSTLVAVGGRCGKPVCSLTPETHNQQYYNKNNTDYPQHDSEEDEPDVSKGHMEAHDTPSRVPLIWRQSSGQRAPTPPLAFRSAAPTPASSPSASVAAVPNHARVPPVLVVAVLLVYVSGGAVVFASWENWSYIDSAYFCFVTLSTIGFGDLVPGKSLQISSGADNNQEGQIQLIACCVYLLFGLAVIAMCFSLMQDEITYRSRRLAVYFGLVKKTQLDL